MSTATLELPDQITVKAMTGQIGIDEAKGIVECLVSGIGNKDSVGDVVVSGAFDSSLKRRQPRVVWGHDWNQPIGKVLEIFEISANDPRLPPKMKAAGIGALYARVQFNLSTERGREAFANVAFYGSDQEWSIGYKTITADYDPDRQANLLKEVELYEISPVLHGANQLTATLSVKDATPNLPEGVDNTLVGKMTSLLSRGMNADVKILDVADGQVVFLTLPGVFWKTAYEINDDAIHFGGARRVEPGVPVWNEIVQPHEKTDVVVSGNIASGETNTSLLESGAATTYSVASSTTDANTIKGFWQNDGFFVSPYTTPYTTHVTSGSNSWPTKCAECEERKTEDPTEEPANRTALDDLTDAYSKLLTLTGAKDIRGKVKDAIIEVKTLLDTIAEETIKETTSMSGYVVHVKCSPSESVEVFNSVVGIPVYVSVHEKGIDLRCSNKVEHDELMGMVAKSLATLSFTPNISVSVPEDTDSVV